MFMDLYSVAERCVNIDLSIYNCIQLKCLQVQNIFNVNQ